MQRITSSLDCEFESSALSSLSSDGKVGGFLRDLGVRHNGGNGFTFSKELQEVFKALVIGSNAQEEFDKILHHRPTDEEELKELVQSLENKFALMEEDANAERAYQKKVHKLVRATTMDRRQRLARKLAEAKREKAKLEAKRAAEAAVSKQEQEARDKAAREEREAKEAKFEAYLAAQREEERLNKIAKAAAAEERRKAKELEALAKAKAMEEARQAKKLAKLQHKRGRA